MRNPNGYGSIVKINRKNLRNKYNVRVSVNGRDGKQHRKSLGYYHTREEALSALNAYHENKVETELSKISFQELWAEWIETKEADETLSASTKKGYKYSYSKIPDTIKKAQISSILFRDFQAMFNELRKSIGYDSLRKIRTDISMLYDYALINKIVGVNFIPKIDIGKSRRATEVLTFNDDQIKRLWKDYTDNVGNSQAQLAIKVLLCLIYNGCRISEFLNLETKDVFISDRYFNITDAKTENGIRQVPIHEAMVPIYQSFYKNYNKYFLTCDSTNTKFGYANFRDSYYDQLIDYYNWSKDLTPHNVRKTCSSLLKRFNADTMYHKLILGHSGALTLTEKVYTKVDVEKLVETINKIPVPLAL